MKKAMTLEHISPSISKKLSEKGIRVEPSVVKEVINELANHINCLTEPGDYIYIRHLGRFVAKKRQQKLCKIQGKEILIPEHVTVTFKRSKSKKARCSEER